MTPRNIIIGAYVAWCLAALAAFSYAAQQGYAAFAASSRPTPIQPVAGQRHK